MARPTKQLTEEKALADLRTTENALELLRQARDLLTDVGAEQTLKRVRLSISSAAGAVRHAQNRWITAKFPPATTRKACVP